eukprot:TRINITY_DN48457_c0_g1_i1.p1 TRINITY_DN48457_c0_g1~~TRINITY_DN48457_c0_g1_i1.p1  ORF type:complete len:461 (-),score=36.21 TRINITY_DN48457_c0_g1_i1:614-1996(-)
MNIPYKSGLGGQCQPRRSWVTALRSLQNAIVSLRSPELSEAGAAEILRLGVEEVEDNRSCQTRSKKKKRIRARDDLEEKLLEIPVSQVASRADDLAKSYMTDRNSASTVIPEVHRRSLPVFEDVLVLTSQLVQAEWPSSASALQSLLLDAAEKGARMNSVGPAFLRRVALTIETRPDETFENNSEGVAKLLSASEIVVAAEYAAAVEIGHPAVACISALTTQMRSFSDMSLSSIRDELRGLCFQDAQWRRAVQVIGQDSLLWELFGHRLSQIHLPSDEAAQLSTISSRIAIERLSVLFGASILESAATQRVLSLHVLANLTGYLEWDLSLERMLEASGSNRAMRDNSNSRFFEMAMLHTLRRSLPECLVQEMIAAGINERTANCRHSVKSTANAIEFILDVITEVRRDSLDLGQFPPLRFPRISLWKSEASGSQNADNSHRCAVKRVGTDDLPIARKSRR